MEEIFTLKDVGYKQILNIAHLTIEKGKVTAIIGKSGSGKSTLLKLLNHLISCDRGEIFFNGQRIETIDPINLRREVVMLPQQPVIFKGSVRENLLIGVQFSEKRVPTDHELTETIQSMNLTCTLDQQAEELSGGEKQRLAFARVILMDPDVYLLDEPTSALDEQNAHEIIKRFITMAKKQKKTVIMVTHANDIAREFADQIVDITTIK